MKTFVLTVSKTFPKTHKRSGESTGFVPQIISLFTVRNTKIHTIRANYDLWEKRAKEINEERAVLSIRYWSDKPYNSRQVEICELSKIGIQKLAFKDGNLFSEIAISPDKDRFHSYTIADIAKNDGLSFEDFKDWFKKYDLSKPMAIIHFTNFRY